jgi:hypothetical protein
VVVFCTLFGVHHQALVGTMEQTQKENGQKQKKSSFALLYSSGSPTPTTTAMTTTMAGEKENVDNVHKHQHKVFSLLRFCWLVALSLSQQKGKCSPKTHEQHTKSIHTEKALNPGDFSVCGRRKFRLFFLLHNNTCFV